MNHIPGIHDNGPRDHGLWRLTFNSVLKVKDIFLDEGPIAENLPSVVSVLSVVTVLSIVTTIEFLDFDWLWSSVTMALLVDSKYITDGKVYAIRLKIYMYPLGTKFLIIHNPITHLHDYGIKRGYWMDSSSRLWNEVTPSTVTSIKTCTASTHKKQCRKRVCFPWVGAYSCMYCKKRCQNTWRKREDHSHYDHCVNEMYIRY